jgi:hypothetical protein
MARVSKTGRELLQRAVRSEGLLLPAPRSARERGATETLLRRGLLRETLTVIGGEWRTDAEGGSLGAPHHRQRPKGHRSLAPAGARAGTVYRG